MMSKGPQLTTSNSEWVEEPDNTITGLWFVGREKDKDLVLTKARATTAYKILNDKLILPPDLLPLANPLKQTRLTDQVRVGPNFHLLEPHARLNIVNKTFFYSAPRTWNTLVSPEQATAPSAESFKKYFC